MHEERLVSPWLLSIKGPGILFTFFRYVVGFSFQAELPFPNMQNHINSAPVLFQLKGT